MPYRGIPSHQLHDGMSGHPSFAPAVPPVAIAPPLDDDVPPVPAAPPLEDEVPPVPAVPPVEDAVPPVPPEAPFKSSGSFTLPPQASRTKQLVNQRAERRGLSVIMSELRTARSVPR